MVSLLDYLPETYADGDDVYGTHDVRSGGGIRAWIKRINDVLKYIDGTTAGAILKGFTAQGYVEAVTTISASGTAQTLDISAATIIDITLTGNCTITMPTVANGKSFVVRLRTGAGSFTATFTGVKWPAGTAPTITVTAARMDRFAFEADASNWYGSGVQNYTP